ncbi:hypothetical protein R3P38DRAFT_3597003 [Favolaschia claudopus]|uniref:Uncharacterized protein n=1 Tax=Favolaschia claudopus TaxID=2862362 RepID=A0AAW0AFT0_9AGAR
MTPRHSCSFKLSLCAAPAAPSSPTDIQQCPPDPCPLQPIAPSAIPAGLGSVMSAAAPIASMAPSAVPAFALNPVYGDGQKTFSSPPQLLVGTKRPLKALPGADYRVVNFPPAAPSDLFYFDVYLWPMNLEKGDTPIQAARAVIDLLRMDRSFLVSSLQPAGLPRNLISLQFVSEDAGTGAHELSSHKPTGRVKAAAGGDVELVINTSAVNAAPEAPSIADSIAAILRSACANSFEDITSILADTDDEESSDTITDLDTVTAPVFLPSFGFGIPTIVVVLCSYGNLAALSQSNRTGCMTGTLGSRRREVVAIQQMRLRRMGFWMVFIRLTPNTRTAHHQDESATTRRQTVVTTPVEVQCRRSDDEDREDEQIEGPTVSCGASLRAMRIWVDSEDSSFWRGSRMATIVTQA